MLTASAWSASDDKPKTSEGRTILVANGPMSATYDAPFEKIKVACAGWLELLPKAIKASPLRGAHQTASIVFAFGWFSTAQKTLARPPARRPCSVNWAHASSMLPVYEKAIPPQR